MPLNDIAMVVDEIVALKAILLLSTLTITEVVGFSGPRLAAKEKFLAFTRQKNVVLQDVTPPVAKRAAEIRAHSIELNKQPIANKPPKLKTPDAIIAATAVLSGANVLHAFDSDLLNVSADVVGGLLVCHPRPLSGQRAIEWPQ